MDKAEPLRTNPLLSALQSPFRSSEIGLKLTALFGYSKKSGLLVNALLHLDCAGLSFRSLPADAADQNQQPWSVA